MKQGMSSPVFPLAAPTSFCGSFFSLFWLLTRWRVKICNLR